MTIQYDLKWAQTIDGQLCDDSNTSQWISSKEERVETHKIRSEYDAILIGANTFITDLAKLTVRHVENNLKVKQPARIILDPTGKVERELKKQLEVNKLELLAEIKENFERETLLIAPSTNFFNSIGLFIRGNLYHSSFESLFEDPYFFNNLDNSIKEYLPEVQKILVEGGPRLLTHFLKEKQYQNIIVSIASKITGGSKNRVYPNKLLKEADQFDFGEVRVVGTDIMFYLKQKQEIEFGASL